MKKLMILFLPLLLCSFAGNSERAELLLRINNDKISVYFNHIYEDAQFANKEFGIPKALYIAEFSIGSNFGSRSFKSFNEYLISRRSFCSQETNKCSLDQWLECLYHCHGCSKQHISKVKRIIKKYKLDTLSDEYDYKNPIA